MTGWKRYFPIRILDRGLNYYKKGKVKGFRFDKDGCCARVLGTHVYYVSITGLRNGNLRMSCGCPYAQDGNACKHMAAVLYMLEENDAVVSGEESRTVTVASSLKQGTGIFYDLKKATRDWLVRQDVLGKAKAAAGGDGCRLENPFLQYDRFYAGFGDEKLPVLYSEAEHADIEGVRTEILLNRDSIRLARCPYCGSLYQAPYYVFQRKETSFNPCVHLAAHAIALQEYLVIYNPGDRTDLYGMRFLNAFGNAALLGAGENEDARPKNVTLKPRVSNDCGQLMLSFRIGAGKDYVVRNMTKLVSCVQHESSYPLGKKSVLHFREQTFTEPADLWYELIEQNVTERLRLSDEYNERHSYMDFNLEITSQISLQGSTLDRFYELSEGSCVEYQDEDGKKGQLLTGSFTPDIAISITPLYPEAGKPPEGIHLEARVPKALSGVRNRYLLEGDRLGKLDEQAQPYLMTLLAASRNGAVSLNIGEKHLQHFFYRTFPKLAEDPSVRVVMKERQIIDAMLPPEAAFSFYLDAENGAFLCRAKVSYEETDYILKAVPDVYGTGRDVEEEVRCVEMLLRYFPEYDSSEDRFDCVGDEDAMFTLLDRGLDELRSFGEVYTTDAFTRKGVVRKVAVQVGVSLSGGLMDLDVDMQDIRPQELLEVLESYRRRKTYHRLKDGRFVDLAQEESLETLQEMMQSLRISAKEFVSGKMHIPVYRALYLDAMLAERDGVVSHRDRQFRALIREFKTVNESDFEIPQGLKGELRGYQIQGYKWLRFLSRFSLGGILADDMGLGKTLQMIAVFLAAREEGEKGTSLVVCPASLVYNWIEEIQRFAPSLTAVPVTGTKAERKKILQDANGKDVLVTSYDLLRRDAELYEDRTFLYGVLDEAQYVKNPKAGISKAVRLIKSDHRFALTGTPIENRLSELWSIFDYLMPGFLYSYEVFRAEIETPVSSRKDEKVSERLRKMVAPFILRRLKNDVLKDLPEKLEEVRYVRLEGQQKKIYNAQTVRMRKKLQDMKEDDFGRGRIEIFAELTRLRQICCDPSLLFENYEEESAKRLACMETVKSAIDGGHRILLFSQFTSMLALLEEDLEREGIAYYKITGSTSKEERIQLVRSFNEPNCPVPVFLISLKAGGTGLNLTGADIVIHYDPWWNLAAQNQATDRAHRIGQTKTVTVFRLIMKDTIEEKILALQESKMDLAESILNGETVSLSKLTKEELLGLLNPQ